MCLFRKNKRYCETQKEARGRGGGDDNLGEVLGVSKTLLNVYIFSSSNIILSANQETHNPLGVLTESIHTSKDGKKIILFYNSPPNLAPFLIFFFIPGCYT